MYAIVYVLTICLSLSIYIYIYTHVYNIYIYIYIYIHTYIHTIQLVDSLFIRADKSLTRAQGGAVRCSGAGAGPGAALASSADRVSFVVCFDYQRRGTY